MRAVELAETILSRFYDPERGGFFSAADDHTGLIARRKDLEDAPIPAGASAACFGLLRLARLTGEAPLRGRRAVADRAAAHGRARAPAGVRAPAAGDRLPRSRRSARSRWRATTRGARRGRAPRLPPARGPRGRRRHRGPAAGRAGSRSTAARPPTSASASRAPAGNQRRRIGELVAIASCSVQRPARSCGRRVHWGKPTVRLRTRPRRGDSGPPLNGVSRRSGLDQCGLSDNAIARRRQRGTLHRIHPGVYSVNAPPLSMQARFLAATKAVDGVLSHYLRRALGGSCIMTPNGPVHVTLLPNSKRGRTRLASSTAPRDPQIIRRTAIPVTTPARALIDLSSMQSFTPLRRAVREGFALKRVMSKNCEDRPNSSTKPWPRATSPPNPNSRTQPTTPSSPTFSHPRSNRPGSSRHPHPARLPLARPQPHRRSRRRPVSRHAHRLSGRRRQTGPARGPRRSRRPRDLNEVMTQPDQAVTRIRMAGVPRRAG